MTNWRELLDAYKTAVMYDGEYAKDGPARRAIERALNRAGGMCWGCHCFTKHGALTDDPFRLLCADCGQPYDAPEGT